MSEAVTFGITDPTLRWVDQVETFHRTPGIDLFEPGHEAPPSSGYLLGVHINFENPSSEPSLKVDIFRYNSRGDLVLGDIQRTNYPGVKAEVFGVASAQIVCANPRDEMYAHLPRSATTTTLRLSEESKRIVAVANTTYDEPKTLVRRVFHTYNPLRNPNFGSGHAARASLTRIVAVPAEAEQVFDMLGRASELGGLDLDVFCGESVRVLHDMNRAITAAEQTTNASKMIGSTALRFTASGGHIS